MAGRMPSQHHAAGSMASVEGKRMYVSRLSFHTRPGHTEEVARRLRNLAHMVVATGSVARGCCLKGLARFLRPAVRAGVCVADGTWSTACSEWWLNRELQQWSRETSELLLQPPKREILTIEGEP